MTRATVRSVTAAAQPQPFTVCVSNFACLSVSICVYNYMLEPPHKENERRTKMKWPQKN